MAKGLGGFTSSLKANRTLPERLIELVRLRIAFHNQCRSCMAIRYPEALSDGVTEDLVCSLERPMEAEDLDDRERLAIRYGSCSPPTTSPSTTSSMTGCGSCSRSRRSSSSGSTWRCRRRRSSLGHVGHGGRATRPFTRAGRADAVGRRRRDHRAQPLKLDEQLHAVRARAERKPTVVIRRVPFGARLERFREHLGCDVGPDGCVSTGSSRGTVRPCWL